MQCLTLEVSGRCHDTYEDTATHRSGPLDRIVRLLLVRTNAHSMLSVAIEVVLAARGKVDNHEVTV